MNEKRLEEKTIEVIMREIGGIEWYDGEYDNIMCYEDKAMKDIRTILTKHLTTLREDKGVERKINKWSDGRIMGEGANCDCGNWLLHTHNYCDQCGSKIHRISE